MSLFSELELAGLAMRNRIAVSPMCQYSCSSMDGVAGDWHLVHYGAFATGRPGLITVEATGVSPEGRITPFCLGIWGNQHTEPLARIVRFIKSQGVLTSIQLIHAGRKGGATAPAPSEEVRSVPSHEGGWETMGPSSIAFGSLSAPKEMTHDDIKMVVGQFKDAAQRALEAGFDTVEVHGAHGYLIHAFLSPLSNKRTDAYGGSFENRTRFCLEVVRAVRAVLPERCPLFTRISATDWEEGGWNIEESVRLSALLKQEGVTVVDVSTGGITSHPSIPVGAGYQTEFSSRIRRETGVLTSCVGLITSPAQADHIIRTGQADIVTMGRELLRQPRWPLLAAQALFIENDGVWPRQYFPAIPPKVRVQ